MDSESIQCEIIDTPNESNWDPYVDRFDNGDFFHKSAWSNLLSETYGHSLHNIIYRKNGKIISAIPLMEVNSLLTGKRGVSLPFTDSCPLLLMEDEVSSNDVVESVLKFGRSRNWRYFELRLNELLDNRIPSIEFYGHSLDLSIGQSELWARCSSSARRAVKRAKSKKVEIRFLEGIDAAKEYYKLHCLTRKRHGLPPQSWKFFSLLGKSCLAPGKGFATIASADNRSVAGAIYLIDKGRAHYKFGASDVRYQTYRGNNLVMWESICRLEKDGVKSLGMGRTSMNNDGLRRFKLHWGCRESSLYYYRLRTSDGKVIPMKDRTKGVHTEVFRRLPVPVLRWVGMLGYRHQS